ncbi:MAG: putative polysaccharide biosynthesis protein [Lawsonibacter sp.]|jgi:stage V sporulation protein B
MAHQRQAPRRVAGQQPKTNTFFGGAAILAVGIMVVKVIGMFYKIPLVWIIGDQGTADFNNAYNIYAVLLTISTAGLPVAVSKLVSEASATGRYNQVRRTFRLALALFLTLGVLSFLVMFFQADRLASMMHDTKAAAGIRALAPAVICVGCLSAFRGYSQGRSNMTPTAVSQIIEAMCKLVVGLGLAFWLVKAGQGEDMAAAGAITGVTVGTIVALAYMILSFFTRQDRDPLSRDLPDPSGSILRSILRIAIPITLSSSMVGIVTVIDSSLVQGQLQRVLLENPDSWALYAGFVDLTPLQQALDAWTPLLSTGASADLSTLKQQAAQALAAQDAGTTLTALETAALSLHTTLEGISRTLYGNYSGALNIYNLPTSLMAAMTSSVIPAVSAALARRDRRATARITGSALRITALLAFPMGVGLFVLGKPIMRLLFSASLNVDLAGPLLSTLGLATVFVCMMLVCNSILQAHGFVNLPVLIMVAGGVVKIFINYNAVSLPGVGIYGAPLGNIFCFGLCLALGLVVIARVIPHRPSYIPIFAKPMAASALMGGSAWAVYGLVSRQLSHIPEGETQRVLSNIGNAIATLSAITVAIAVYLVLVVALKCLSRDDLALMPKGEKLARLLRL